MNFEQILQWRTDKKGAFFSILNVKLRKTSGNTESKIYEDEIQTCRGPSALYESYSLIYLQNQCPFQNKIFEKIILMIMEIFLSFRNHCLEFK